MTVKEKLIEMLTQKGLFQQQAENIVNLTIPIIENETNNAVALSAEDELDSEEEKEDAGNKSGYKISWDSPYREYPDVLYRLWYVKMKPVALKWFEDNLPDAWCKSMFE